MSTEVCPTQNLDERVKIVSMLVRQTVASWLEVAKHVRAAKKELNEAEFDNFVELTGLTKTICDKLCRIGEN